MPNFGQVQVFQNLGFVRTMPQLRIQNGKQLHHSGPHMHGTATVSISRNKTNWGANDELINRNFRPSNRLID